MTVNRTSVHDKAGLSEAPLIKAWTHQGIRSESQQIRDTPRHFEHSGSNINLGLCQNGARPDRSVGLSIGQSSVSAFGSPLCIGPPSTSESATPHTHQRADAQELDTAMLAATSLHSGQA